LYWAHIGVEERKVVIFLWCYRAYLLRSWHSHSPSPVMHVGDRAIAGDFSFPDYFITFSTARDGVGVGHDRSTAKFLSVKVLPGESRADCS
jgi:hypothetical protein